MSKSVDHAPRWQVRRGALTIAREIEIAQRVEQARAVRRPDHVDLDPADDFVDPDSGRRRLIPDPAHVLIGRYLRRSRRYARKTQKQLAADSGLSQSMISRVERGRAPGMRFDRFIQLCLTLAELFPLGACPHDHECGWQPVKPRGWTITNAEAHRYIEYLLKTAGER